MICVSDSCCDMGAVYPTVPVRNTPKDNYIAVGTMRCSIQSNVHTWFIMLSIVRWTHAPHSKIYIPLFKCNTVFLWSMGYPIFKLIIKYLFSIINKLIKSKDYSIINSKTIHSINQSREHQTILDVIKFNYETVEVNTSTISTHQYNLS